MRAIKSIAFQQKLTTYLKLVNDQAEPLLITTPTPDNDVIVLSLAEYQALITSRIMANDYHPQTKQSPI
ncbi:type II toxin-antitoxin system prevent-host-death family antitoxin [Lactiplantibacillus mudanjiangensis]|uniref:Prevent-host-death protein [Lactobacillus koreensis] n=1 Tax=Lactiplantibacillus mudanjiangensis TaxID=1296538 RepID=A0A660E4U9_9LACO|nr:type II toxin-antitoxin system prevent-host-death family antitoxin [Lactiplantibacillus mudanjiangensis]VDG20440.1 prevent-host-death protein [Lactobacillus koreensis] [Lactiplantibacillus mudanjiangensis]VDG25413.1 prevent-host-death protein [Lactobacillus koreensis] [Lactiplantibacillus mudanjiangensis]VDG30408.1 prevent-host-death protein [Lactobacillus koreensis] [Lactiplantibacillus mudanjiangensis]VDG30809.1 prevent-host-death protein [Lactobacillus koreensis] [Lactiplantibacillus muda